MKLNIHDLTIRITCHDRRHKQSTCSHVQTRVVGTKNREWFRSAILFSVDYQILKFILSFVSKKFYLLSVGTEFDRALFAQ